MEACTEGGIPDLVNNIDNIVSFSHPWLNLSHPTPPLLRGALLKKGDSVLLAQSKLLSLADECVNRKFILNLPRDTTGWPDARHAGD